MFDENENGSSGSPAAVTAEGYPALEEHKWKKPCLRRRRVYLIFDLADKPIGYTLTKQEADHICRVRGDLQWEREKDVESTTKHLHQIHSVHAILKHPCVNERALVLALGR